ncbi:MAG: hypothetical protein GY757_56880 [bacterium]|nr:hypothetical protein [bacterium]
MRIKKTKLLFNVCCMVLLLQLVSCYNLISTGDKNAQTAILGFELADQAEPAFINRSAHTVDVSVQNGTALTGLVPFIAIAEGASISPGSGETVDFSRGSVCYTVISEKGDSREWVVTVTVAEPGSEKEITGFRFLASQNSGLSEDAAGVINETDRTISLLVPFRVEMNGLVAAFETTGDSVRINETEIQSGVTAVDYTYSVLFRVTAENLSTREYRVLVEYSCPENVYIGDYTINTSGDLELLSGYTRITGALTIGGDYNNFSSLLGLQGLECLSRVDGDLVISFNGHLQNLEGLKGLTSIGGMLRVYYNSALVTLKGLDRLGSISGDLRIEENPGMESLEGLNALKSIEGSVWFYENQMENIAALANCSFIGGAVDIKYK